MKHIFAFLFFSFLVSFGWASQTLQVTRHDAPVYDGPSTSATVLTRLKQGRTLQTDGRTENGFIRLSTKSGRSLWVRSADVSYQDVEADLAEDEEAPTHGRGRELHDFPRFTYDLGASTGSVNGFSYTEINLGLNTFFRDWIAWRNAVFYRFQSGANSVYGLDTSARGILSIGQRALGLTLFAGPGYRFINEGLNAPFVEGGAIVKLAGFSLGAGAKTIMNSMVDSRGQNDTQIFLILAGGGSF